MKTLILILIIVICPILNFGQSLYRPALQKGSVLTGGSVETSFGKSKSEYSYNGGSSSSETGYFSFTLTPKAGYFVSNGLALGLALDLTSTTYKEKDDKETRTIFTAGPVIRYYTAGGLYLQALMSLGKDIYIFYNPNFQKREGNIIRCQTGIGYAFFLNDFVAIEPSITYRNTTTKGEYYGEKFKSSIGEFVLGVGFSIFLHKKPE